MNWLKRKLQHWLEIAPERKVRADITILQQRIDGLEDVFDSLLNDLIRIAPREQQNRMKIEWRNRLERRL